METKPNYEPPKQVWLVFFYQVICLFCVLAGLTFARQISLSLEFLGKSRELFWMLGLCGVLGGVSAAFRALWVHVSVKKDYQVEYALWYFAAPPIGLALGMLIGPLIELGFIGGSGSANVVSPFLLYCAAWLVGFRQNSIFHWARGIFQKLSK